MLTCFDMNFQEAWMSAYAQGVDVLLWPSAYGGGLNMRAYAALFGLRIIPAGIGDITDITGRVADGHRCECSGSWMDFGGNDNSGYCPGCQSPSSACLCSADLDLDMTLIHSDQGAGAPPFPTPSQPVSNQGCRRRRQGRRSR
jgi:predicted amidohydrolase